MGALKKMYTAHWGHVEQYIKYTCKWCKNLSDCLAPFDSIRWTVVCLWIWFSSVYSTESPSTFRPIDYKQALHTEWCAISRSDAAKSCHIIYVTKLSLPTYGIIRLLPDTRTRCFEKRKKNASRIDMYERGGWRRSLQIYNRSIALSLPFSEYNTIWSFLKWIRARFPPRIRSWLRLQIRCVVPNGIFYALGVGCFRAGTVAVYAMAWLNGYRRWNGGLGWGGSYPFILYIMITTHKPQFAFNRTATQLGGGGSTKKKGRNRCICNSHHINGKCHHGEPRSFIAPDDRREEDTAQIRWQPAVEPRQRHAISRRNAPLTQYVRATTHRYLQFHHVCTARRGNSSPWLHPMAHTALFPPDRLLQVSTHASRLQLVVARRGAQTPRRIWHRFTVQVRSRPEQTRGHAGRLMVERRRGADRRRNTE